VVTLATPAPASAHTELVGSTPTQGSRLVVAPGSISLEFSEAVDPTLAAMVVSVDGGDPVRLAVSAGASPSIVRADVPAAVGPASEDTRWRVDYRVTSVDGHPIVGRVTFSVAAEAPNGDPSQASELEPHATSHSPAAADADGGRGSAWVVGAAFLMLLVLALPAVLVVVRRRRAAGDPPRGEQP
jgi:methionine-rich copper-binding protein CopC